MEQVTVRKQYFDALLRRADFFANVNESSAHRPGHVTITQQEYNVLVRNGQDFERLKQVLIDGGTTKETINILLTGKRDTDLDESMIDTHTAPRRTLRPLPSDLTSSRGLNPVHRPSKPGQARQTSNDYSAPEDEYYDYDTNEVQSTRHDSIDLEETAYRTLYLTNLPESTTLRDLISVIRGGTIISVHILSSKHSKDRVATVSFYDGAAEFLAWVIRNDLYLNGKRVEVRWAKRQFKLDGWLKDKMNTGVTRNLLIGNAVAKGITAEQIRVDMEHIDKLKIVDISFHNGNAYVGTNTVRNAIYARTCMQSRKTYQGCKVEFIPDECAGPLRLRPSTRTLSAAKGTERKVSPLSNRFDALRMDDDN